MSDKPRPLHDHHCRICGIYTHYDAPHCTQGWERLHIGCALYQSDVPREVTDALRELAVSLEHLKGSRV